MPKMDFILNIPGLKVVGSRNKLPVELNVEIPSPIICPRCQSHEFRKKCSLTRRIRHENFGKRSVYLWIKTWKYHCKKCLHFFRPPIPGVRKWQRATDAFKSQVCQTHQMGVSQKELADQWFISCSTIERWFWKNLKRKDHAHQASRCPMYLGIDEHRVCTKVPFATTLCDLGKHKIFDILPGRSQTDLHHSLMALPGRDQVKVVCMDLSESYRRLVKTYFPQAQIVADRFHVIRLVNHAFLKTFQELDPQIKSNRMKLGLLRPHAWNLSMQKQPLMKTYLDNNPAIQVLYEVKQTINQLLLSRRSKKKQWKELIKQFLYWKEHLKSCPFPYLKTLGKTLEAWQEEIARMWRYAKNNAITEGFHRKMKLIQRRAYGFKNFENYRLRVKVLCG
jgi:transposase